MQSSFSLGLSTSDGDGGGVGGSSGGGGMSSGRGSQFLSFFDTLRSRDDPQDSLDIGGDSLSDPLSLTRLSLAPSDLGAAALAPPSMLRQPSLTGALTAPGLVVSSPAPLLVPSVVGGVATGHPSFAAVGGVGGASVIDAGGVVGGSVLGVGDLATGVGSLAGLTVMPPVVSASPPSLSSAATPVAGSSGGGSGGGDVQARLGVVVQILNRLQPVGPFLLQEAMATEADGSWRGTPLSVAGRKLLGAVTLAMQGLSMVDSCLTGATSAAMEMKRSIHRALAECQP